MDRAERKRDTIGNDMKKLLAISSEQANYKHDAFAHYSELGAQLP